MEHPIDKSCERQEADARGAARARPGAVGAPPSNTAPDKYTGPIKQVLRFGVDSLYLSYAGELSESWRDRLEELKGFAQSEDSKERGFAQVKIGEHLFEVKDKGKGRHAFVLQDNAFHVAVSRRNALPLAYMQIGSEFLAHLGVEAAEERARYVVASLGRIDGAPTVSRADVFLDFVAPVPLNAWPMAAWVTRAESVMTYSINQQPSGWVIGQGGDISARLYDKTLEIKKSRAFYNYVLWSEAGWDASDKVYRLEVQFRRAVLNELGIHIVPELLANQERLWRYFTEEWLRLCVPSSDENRSRWATDPLWKALGEAPISSIEAFRLKRFRYERIPEDDHILRPIAGFLSSFMAKRNIRSAEAGLREMARDLRRYYGTVGNKDGLGFADFVALKAAEKGKRYNTMDNRPRDPSHEAGIAAIAEAYRRRKDGDAEP